MNTSVRRLIAGLAAATSLLGAASQAQAASIWTPMDSGTTTGIIQSVDYQSDSRLWYATSNGKLAYRDGSTFKFGTGPTATVSFNKIAFQPGTNNGLAVGNSNNVWRSGNGGKDWSKVTISMAPNPNCDSSAHPATTTALGDVTGISWAPSGDVVYLSGPKGVILRSTNAGVSFTDINHDSNGANCKIDGDISDVQVVSAGSPSTSDNVYFDDGGLLFTSDGLSSAPSRRTSGMTNYAGSSSSSYRRFVIDPVSPNRMWAIVNGCGFTCWNWSEDSFASGDTNCICDPKPDKTQTPAYGLSYANGTTLIAGDAGEIVNSIDGKNFFFNNADGNLATKDWRAIATYDGTHAIVAGRDGAMASTTTANFVPDLVKPTSTGIAGPTKLAAGQAATYTLAAADTGGSGLNAAATQWSVAGLPTQTGATATFAFPTANYYTITATYFDNAGNAGDPVTLGVSVTAPIKTDPPVASFTSAGNPLPSAPLKTSKDSKGRKIVKINIKGKLGIPSGVSAGTACKGVVAVTVTNKKGKKTKTVGSGRASVKSNCTYKRTISILKSKIYGKKVTVILDYAGNTNVLGKSSYKQVLKLK